MQQTNASAKILSWSLTTSKDDQNTAFIQISQKIAVEYPGIFLKFLEDFQKKSGKFSEDLTHNAKELEKFANRRDADCASVIASHLRHEGTLAAIKEFRAWTSCGLKDAKDCIDRLRSPQGIDFDKCIYGKQMQLISIYM
jgi:hypothetical protein